MSPDAQSVVPVEPDLPLAGKHLRTPRSAAIAGILFSILLITSLLLLQIPIPRDPTGIDTWLLTSSERVPVALNLVPFAGIAFMWFLGVLRDRLGAMEDKFFATVFLGSGLMFLGMIFVAAAATGGLIFAHAVAPRTVSEGSEFAFGRAFTYDVMHIYAFKMAAVFMISTSTLAIRTHVTARWVAILGYVSAAFLLIGSGYIDWTLFAFPCWVLVLSVYVLVDNFRKPPQAVADCA